MSLIPSINYSYTRGDSSLGDSSLQLHKPTKKLTRIPGVINNCWEMSDLSKCLPSTSEKMITKKDWKSIEGTLKMQIKVDRNYVTFNTVAMAVICTILTITISYFAAAPLGLFGLCLGPIVGLVIFVLIYRELPINDRKYRKRYLEQLVTDINQIVDSSLQCDS